MAISNKLQLYLKQHDVSYQLISHPHSAFSMESAEKAHVPGDALAKGILVKEDGEYLLVVVPSDYHVELDSLHKLLGKEVKMAEEAELIDLLPDCELGAIPATGHVFGIKTMWDPNTTLGKEEQVYFEAGDHRHLVQVSGKQFHELMAEAERGEFSHHF
jgi:Ala-tRNA(Pro) deacylase